MTVLVLLYHAVGVFCAGVGVGGSKRVPWSALSVLVWVGFCAWLWPVVLVWDWPSNAERDA